MKAKPVSLLLVMITCFCFLNTNFYLPNLAQAQNDILRQIKPGRGITNSAVCSLTEQAIPDMSKEDRISQLADQAVRCLFSRLEVLIVNLAINQKTKKSLRRQYPKPNLPYNFNNTLRCWVPQNNAGIYFRNTFNVEYSDNHQKATVKCFAGTALGAFTGKPITHALQLNVTIGINDSWEHCKNKNNLRQKISNEFSETDSNNNEQMLRNLIDECYKNAFDLDPYPTDTFYEPIALDQSQINSAIDSIKAAYDRIYKRQKYTVPGFRPIKPSHPPATPGASSQPFTPPLPKSPENNKPSSIDDEINDVFGSSSESAR